MQERNLIFSFSSLSFLFLFGPSIRKKQLYTRRD